ncbi:MAG: dUTP diphosphatase [Microgenomates group bacterium]
MKLPIKLIDESLPPPSYQTKGAVAFDLYSRVNLEIPPWQTTIIPLNLIVKIPKGFFLMIAARSSLALKKNLILANGVGVIDQDYHGQDDEIKASVINFSQKTVTVKKGERIAQGILVKIAKVEKFVKMEKIKKKSRGGFGSTN